MNAVSRVGAITLPDAGVAAPARKAYVDVFRGLLIAHMALDHTSLMFNAGRGAEELASSAPAAPADIFQFQTGVPVFDLVTTGSVSIAGDGTSANAAVDDNTSKVAATHGRARMHVNVCKAIAVPDMAVP